MRIDRSALARLNGFAPPPTGGDGSELFPDAVKTGEVVLTDSAGRRDMTAEIRAHAREEQARRRARELGAVVALQRETGFFAVMPDGTERPL